MEENADVVDYIREARTILADSMDVLLNLQHDLRRDEDEGIVPVNDVVELIDMGYDVAHFENLKKAETEFMKREPF